MRHLSLFLFCAILAFTNGCGKEAKQTQGAAPIAVLTISETPAYDYGIRDVGTSWDHTFSVTNVGGAVATEITSSFYLSLSFGFKDGAFPGTGGNCPEKLNPQDSCTVVVTYTVKFAGPAQSALNVSYHNGSSSVTVSGPILSGQGNVPAETPSPTPEPPPPADPGTP